MLKNSDPPVLTDRAVYAINALKEKCPKDNL